MINKFISIFLVFVMCSMQCSFAANNINVNSYAIPTYNNNTNNNVQTTNASLGFGKGKVLKAFLQNTVSTTDVTKGDPIVVILSENWVENGNTVAEAGSVINGIISSANSAGGWSKNGALQIEFNSMETPDGKIYGLTTEKIDIQIEEKKEKGKWIKNAAKVGGVILAAAAVGALMGVSGEPTGTKTTSTTTYGPNSTTTTYRTSSDKEYGKDASRGAIIGASIGAVLAVGGGIVIAASKNGEDITIPANTSFEILLTEDIVLNNY